MHLPAIVGAVVALAGAAGPVPPSSVSFELAGSAASEDDGPSLSLIGTFDGRIGIAPGWRLGLEWPIAMLLTPGGVIEDLQTGERSIDAVPRTGNPTLEADHRLSLGEGADLWLGGGFSFPMASIAQPSPPEGEPFRRAPHDEAVLRWALGARGFVEPWAFLWNTATARAFGVYRRRIERIELGGWLHAGLLLPAGRLRAEVGALVTAGGRLRYHLDPLEVGVRFDLGVMNSQRSSFDDSKQIEGGELAVSPEVRLNLPDGAFLDARVTVVPGVEVDPAPPVGWGFALAVGAEL